MKKILAILGAGVVAGVVVFVVCNKLRKKYDSAEITFKGETADVAPTEAVPTVIHPTCAHTVADTDDAKNNTIHNVTARHEEAAEIMKDAVDIICKRSEVHEDEGKDLEQISNDLDDLLNEV